MLSPHPSGDSKTLIIDSQQPTDDSKSIDISIEKRANVVTAAFCIFQNINNGFTNYKTITISIEQRTNVLTTAFWRFQNINNGLTTTSC